MNKIIRIAQCPLWAGAAAVLAAGLMACGPSHSGSAHSAASSIAANPSVQADEQEAAQLVRHCVTAAHVAAFKTCLENQVPVPARAALKACVASAAASSVGKKGARALFEQGAQACVATALKGSANIPGITPSPGASS